MVRTFGRDKIKVETEVGNPDNVATEQTLQEVMEDMSSILMGIQNTLKVLNVRTSGSNRLPVDIITGALASITTLSTLTNANNLTNIAGVNGWVLLKGQSVANFNSFVNSL